MIKYLLSKASTGKFRWWSCECDEEWHEPEHGYIIKRKYGQVGGKTTESPNIIVAQTKQKRNWKEQYTLQFNSEVKKQLDKGYIEVERHPNEYSIEELPKIYGEVSTNQAGVIKPMLAKQESKLTNRKILDKEWMISRKLDGTRCLMYWNGEKVLTASRGGENYDISTTHIRTNDKLIEFFSKYPNIVLDGELYKHGKTLQQISGAARMEKNAYDCEWLQYWVYDMYDKSNPDVVAKDRYEFLFEEFPFSSYADDTEGILLLPERFVSGEDNIWKLHDEYVEEGFEGCVIRNPDRPYKPNGRTNDMIKFKMYKDAEFEITGLSEGLRDEDMCFTLVTEDGIEFKAKPMGTRELKQQYRDDLDQLIGKMATVKYFYLSDEGCPLQPVLKCVRDYE